MSQSESAFWAIADEIEQLRSQLNELTRPGGNLRGFSLGGFDSPQRRQARIVADRLETATSRFKRAQADYILQMRDNVRSMVAESQTLASAVDATRPRGAPGGEFAALRSATRSAITKEAATVSAFEAAKAKLSRR